MRVNDFIGIPYTERNCGALAIYVLSNFGIDLEDPGLAAIRSIAEGKGIARFLPAYWPDVDVGKVEKLDLLFTYQGRTGYHVAIVGEDGWVLNTSKATGSILQELRKVLPHVLTARRPVQCCCT